MQAVYQVKRILLSYKVPLAILLVLSGFWAFNQQGYWGLGFWFLMSAFGYWIGWNEHKRL